MSRSYRKSPFIGITCCDSEKDDKRIANRKLRKAVKKSILVGCEPPLMREISEVWMFGKDGRQMVSDKKWLRK